MTCLDGLVALPLGSEESSNGARRLPQQRVSEEQSGVSDRQIAKFLYSRTGEPNTDPHHPNQNEPSNV